MLIFAKPFSDVLHQVVLLFAYNQHKMQLLLLSQDIGVVDA